MVHVVLLNSRVRRILVRAEEVLLRGQEIAIPVRADLVMPSRQEFKIIIKP